MPLVKVRSAKLGVSGKLLVLESFLFAYAKHIEFECNENISNCVAIYRVYRKINISPNSDIPSVRYILTDAICADARDMFHQW